jgi:hypothetical protein
MIVSFIMLYKPESFVIVFCLVVLLIMAYKHQNKIKFARFIKNIKNFFTFK